MNRRLVVRVRCSGGFTLIEAVVTVVLISVVGTLGMGLLTFPIQGFSDQTRRAALVDIADTALQRMTREIRQALPNSIRTDTSGNRRAIEFLATAGGGRYRASVETGGGGDPLTNGSADTFDVLGTLLVAGAITTGPAGQSNCLNGSADCLVLYNTGTGASDFNAWRGDNIATITAASASHLSFDNGGGWSFPFTIPPTANQRFFIVDTPISFVCDTSTGQLLRFSDYAISVTQPVSDASFGVAGVLLAENVNACQFDYAPGSSARHGLVTLRVTVRDAVGEQVGLLHQAHVLNVP